MIISSDNYKLVEAPWPVKKLKAAIEEKFGIPAHLQCIYCRDEILMDGSILQDHCSDSEKLDGTVKLIFNKWFADAGQLVKYEASFI